MTRTGGSGPAIVGDWPQSGYTAADMTATRLVALDIFAGAGGLTLGARRAGVDVRVAVELNPDASTTYRKNNPETHLLECDVRSITGRDLLELLSEPQPDLLMGCAPCQGFCSLTTKSGREDPRNQLINELARLVEETLPRAVFMEMVPGLASRGSALFDSLIARLRNAGYMPQWWNVEMADYGIPQRRRRLVLLAGHGVPIDLPQATHGRAHRESPRLQAWRTVRDVIGSQRESPRRLSLARKHGGPTSVQLARGTRHTAPNPETPTSSPARVDALHVG